MRWLHCLGRGDATLYSLATKSPPGTEYQANTCGAYAEPDVARERAAALVLKSMLNAPAA